MHGWSVLLSIMILLDFFHITPSSLSWLWMWQETTNITMYLLPLTPLMHYHRHTALNKETAQSKLWNRLEYILKLILLVNSLETWRPPIEGVYTETCTPNVKPQEKSSRMYSVEEIRDSSALCTIEKSVLTRLEENHRFNLKFLKTILKFFPQLAHFQFPY